jgi:hypothetical protein
LRFPDRIAATAPICIVAAGEESALTLELKGVRKAFGATAFFDDVTVTIIASAN